MKHKKQLLMHLSALQKNLARPDLDESFANIQKAIEQLPAQHNSDKSNSDKSNSDKSHTVINFEVPDQVKGNPNAIVIFSDGACRGNPGPGAWGAIAQDHSHKILFELSQVADHTTNNKMELSGALEGMRYLIDYLQQHTRQAGEVDLHVVTDSKYLVDGMNSWVAGWKRRGWKKADKKVPENIELWQGLDELKSRFNRVDFHWVKGHAGHPQNEYCDKLANEALDNEGY